jgi:hypothetical protein
MRVALAAIAPLMVVSAVVLTGGVASAKKAPVPTISCTTVAATVTYNPALVAGTATSKTDQVSISGIQIGGCKVSSGPAVTATSNVTATLSEGKNGNSCSSLTATGGKPTKYTFNVTWNNGGGSSVVKFTGATSTTSPSPGFTFSKGKGTGSFATKDATAAVYLNSTSSAAVAKCVAGTPGSTVSTLTISSGNLSA